jgi:plastocyanin
MKKLALTFVLVLATVTGACSSSSDNTTSGGTSGTSGTTGDSGTSGDSGTTPAGNTVTVKSFSFTPATLTIKAGETVTWTWAGGSHTVTSGADCKGDGAYTSGLKSTTGATFTHTYATAGTFEYFCEPHCQASAMKGTIIVQ